MKRPFLVISIGYIIGIVWGLYCKCNIAFLYGAFYLIRMMALLNKKKKIKIKVFSVFRYIKYLKIILKKDVILTIIIFSLLSYYITINLNRNINKMYTELKDVHLTGVIISNEINRDNGSVYKIKVENLNDNCNFSNFFFLIKIKDKTDIKYGDKIEIIGNYTKPQEQRNYKGFNYQKFLRSQKIIGTINVSKIKRIEHNKYNLILIFTNNLFLNIKSKIETIFPKDISKILIGILTGYTDSDDNNILESLKEINISYILAVSGMQVTYLVTITNMIYKKIFGKKVGIILTIITIIIYLLIIEKTPSSIRAVMMVSLSLGAKIFHRKNDIWNSMFLSLLFLLIYNPFILENMSIILSYSSIIGILTYNKIIFYLLEHIRINNKKHRYKINYIRTIRLKKFVDYIKKNIALFISVNIIITPITIMYNNYFSYWAIISSLLLSFFIGPIIIIGCVIIFISFFSISISKIMAFILIPLIEFIISYSSAVHNSNLDKAIITTPKIITIIIYYFCVLLIKIVISSYMKNNKTQTEYRIMNTISFIKIKMKQKIKKMIFVSVLSMFIINFCIKIPHDLRVYFIDVGQRRQYFNRNTKK